MNIIEYRDLEGSYEEEEKLETRELIPEFSHLDRLNISQITSKFDLTHPVSILK